MRVNNVDEFHTFVQKVLLHLGTRNANVLLEYSDSQDFDRETFETATFFWNQYEEGNLRISSGDYILPTEEDLLDWFNSRM